MKHLLRFHCCQHFIALPLCKRQPLCSIPADKGTDWPEVLDVFPGHSVTHERNIPWVSLIQLDLKLYFILLQNEK